ncbi:MAG: SDR family NAD(P)-dependent oxidoreductase [Candidatus Hydrogenedentes bacterium]|nr:SDR family NAD(P)-dependent oxidoreductase [Candidatus Hydrogenedentota bacterium]
MRDISGKVALVTGAGSGIGRETALALAREGAQLVLCDINADSLEAVRGEIDRTSKCLLAECVDVSSIDAMRVFADKVHAIVPAVDILVNNAGVAVVGTVLTTSYEDWQWIVGINLWGVIHGCHLFTPKMAERGQGGHVVNVSSMLGFNPSPDIASYSTTKFGVFGLSLCMSEDLKEHNIGVSVICPGVINTNITRTVRITGHDDADALRDKYVAFYGKRNYGPEKVARAIVRAIKRRQVIVPVSPESWAGYVLNRIWPGGNRALWHWVSKRVNK